MPLSGTKTTDILSRITITKQMDFSVVRFWPSLSLGVRGKCPSHKTALFSLDAIKIVLETLVYQEFIGFVSASKRPGMYVNDLDKDVWNVHLVKCL